MIFRLEVPLIISNITLKSIDVYIETDNLELFETFMRKINNKDFDKMFIRYVNYQINIFENLYIKTILGDNFNNILKPDLNNIKYICRNDNLINVDKFII